MLWTSDGVAAETFYVYVEDGGRGVSSSDAHQSLSQLLKYNSRHTLPPSPLTCSQRRMWELCRHCRWSLKKNQNTPRLSEHPPVRGDGVISERCAATGKWYVFRT